MQVTKSREFNVFGSYRGAKGRNICLGVTSDYSKV